MALYSEKRLPLGCSGAAASEVFPAPRHVRRMDRPPGLLRKVIAGPGGMTLFLREACGFGRTESASPALPPIRPAAGKPLPERCSCAGPQSRDAAFAAAAASAWPASKQQGKRSASITAIRLHHAGGPTIDFCRANYRFFRNISCVFILILSFRKRYNN